MLHNIFDISLHRFFMVLVFKVMKFMGVGMTALRFIV